MNTTNREPLAAVTMELSELGCGQIYVHANDTDQASAGHRLLAEVQPELRALSAACKKAAAKIHAESVR